MKKARRHPHGDAIGRRLPFNRTPVPIVMPKGLACVAYPWLLVLVRIAHYINGRGASDLSLACASCETGRQCRPHRRRRPTVVKRRELVVGGRGQKVWSS